MSCKGSPLLLHGFQHLIQGRLKWGHVQRTHGRSPFVQQRVDGLGTQQGHGWLQRVAGGGDDVPILCGGRLNEVGFRVNRVQTNEIEFLRSKAIVVVYQIPELADYVQILRCPANLIISGGEDVLQNLEMYSLPKLIDHPKFQIVPSYHPHHNHQDLFWNPHSLWSHRVEEDDF